MRPGFGFQYLVTFDDSQHQRDQSEAMERGGAREVREKFRLLGRALPVDTARNAVGTWWSRSRTCGYAVELQISV